LQNKVCLSQELKDLLEPKKKHAENKNRKIS